MWVKICGVTTFESACAVLESGANAVGLNFFSGSKRFVSVSAAREIAGLFRSKDSSTRTLDIVGVFVNSTNEEIVGIADEVGLTAVQLHGDETLGQICHLYETRPALPIIRAMRASMERLDQHLEDIDNLNRRVPLAACLLDAYKAGEFGGTGMTVDARIPDVYLQEKRPRLILAGGLTPQNVAGVVQQSNPWGVDTASGVEVGPGVKEPDLCRTFVREATKGSGPSVNRLAPC